LKGDLIGYLKSIKRGSLDLRLYPTPDAFCSPSCRKVKAAVRPDPGDSLSQNIALRAILEIAYI
jgi:hypothetical protein